MSFNETLIPVLSSVVPIAVIVIGKSLDKEERKAKKQNNHFDQILESLRKQLEKHDDDIRACEREISKLSGRVDSMEGR